MADLFVLLALPPLLPLRPHAFCYSIPPGCITLQNLAAKVVQENFQEVAFQEEFLSLSLDQVVPYIASDQIDIDCEKDVFDVSSILGTQYSFLYR